MNICEKIAHQLNVKSQQVNAAINLLDEGATVPFIARYRKEMTGGLSDTDLRQLEERLYYLRELETRRNFIIENIKEQNKLTPALSEQLLNAEDKTTLEDLYLPYKPKRRTKAQLAREAGLEPLALSILNDPTLNPNEFATNFISTENNILNTKDALEGARYILMELFAEEASLIGELREALWDKATLTSIVVKDKAEEGIKFKDYFDYAEPIKKIPSHRTLALLRGQREEFLRINLVIDEYTTQECVQKIMKQFNVNDQKRAADDWLIEIAHLTWRSKLFIKLELELIARLREHAEEEAIKVFANNLKHLLMAAPAGSKITLGLDPGLRTGVKVVVIDGTGTLLTHTTIFPHAPRNEWHESISVLAKLCKEFNVELISIGNGTASRETDKLVTELKKQYPQLKLNSIVTSEAGASVYSASEIASEEFPNLDVSFRGAVSIARRVQDPLAELIKIEPKAIGVGQYQHDVSQVKLSRTLEAVMVDCVNAVGVDVNTASIPLLSCVAGLNETIAKNIIEFRRQHGPFTNRHQLKKISRLGEKAFEQSAGFLRIINGDNPLDASAVHPESYAVVEKILQTKQITIKNLMGNIQLIRQLRATDFVNQQVGLLTVNDIFFELEKPGRDPRPEFKTAEFKEGVEDLADLKTNMILEGVITNVANFGAFVDIGVHQDGLVHISMMANHFVKNPHDVVKVGDVVKVKVIEVDVKRKRIQLSMRLENSQSATKKTKANVQNQFMNSTLGNALLDAMKRRN